jgi:protein ImuB
MLVVWCPDWPVVAASMSAALPADTPVAVVAANRVLACSAMARESGVRRGLRRREAQSRCPELVVFANSPERDARSFEPVAVAVEQLAPGIEIVYPGVVAVPVRGVSGYFGGEQAAAERIVDQVATQAGIQVGIQASTQASTQAGVECQVGIADGLFAAILAAHRGVLVSPGCSAEFLAPLGIEELTGHSDPRRGSSEVDRSELVDLLRRLGLRTLGAFAALPERDVASRFGAGAVLAHRLAAGRSERPPVRRGQPPELGVSRTFDPVLERVDAAAFAARALAEELYGVLVAHDLACTRLAIQARTEHGEELVRVWRMADPASATGIGDRLRWQLEGWLSGATGRPSGGLELLRLEPEEVVSGHSLQLGLFRSFVPDGDGPDGDDGVAAERAGRAFVRVQGLLGPDAVFTAVLGGGRGPGGQVRMVPWGEAPPARADQAQAWPGRLPKPSPATVPAGPLAATVLDAAGAEVGVTGRHEMTSAPHRVAVGDRPARRVLAWAGPWPVDERWWQPELGRRLARLQVVLASPDREDTDREDADPEQTALLLVRESGRWLVEGVYD